MLVLRLRSLILLAMIALAIPIAAGGEELIPIHTWDRGIAVTQETQYQYFGFCSGWDCSDMRKPEFLGDAPFSVIPYSSIKKPFIVKTPFVMPNEKEGDIWKGLAEFVEQVQGKE